MSFFPQEEAGCASPPLGVSKNARRLRQSTVCNLRATTPSRGLCEQVDLGQRPNALHNSNQWVAGSEFARCECRDQGLSRVGEIVTKSQTKRSIPSRPASHGRRASFPNQLGSSAH